MRTIVLTRPETVADSVRNDLERLGLPILDLPSLQVNAYIDKVFELQLQQSWNDYSGVMCVSKHAVQFAATRLDMLGLKWRSQTWLAAVGQATALCAQNVWSDAQIVCPDAGMPQDSEALWLTLQKRFAINSKNRVLIVRAQTGRDTFINHLKNAGAHVDVWTCYRREPCVWSNLQKNDFQHALIQTGLVLSITSQEGLSALMSNVEFLNHHERAQLFLQPVLTLHPVISECARSFGFTNVHHCSTQSASAILAVLSTTNVHKPAPKERS